MERGNMSKREAAILLDDMISDLRGSGADNQMYHEAVQALKLLLFGKKTLIMRPSSSWLVRRNQYDGRETDRRITRMDKRHDYRLAERGGNRWAELRDVQRVSVGERTAVFVSTNSIRWTGKSIARHIGEQCVLSAAEPWSRGRTEWKSGITASHVISIL